MDLKKIGNDTSISTNAFIQITKLRWSILCYCIKLSQDKDETRY